ncbi:2',3'-cyclic nucleotide 3'-phosphodiesterase [Lambiella insularis]|nr:2',3'-cyclic nucleotide 3'-phosphodiesterase [Lambiella insularis]
MTLSLWLTPPPSSPIYSHFSQLISSLPQAHPSLNSSPTFLPHVTLSSFNTSGEIDIHVLRIPETLSVSIKCLSFGTAYFKKIYFSMERSSDLLRLAKEARVKLNNMSDKEAQRAVDEEYDPHTSLLYNDVALDDEIKEIVSSLVAEEGNAAGFKQWEGLSWQGGQVLLVRTEGPVEHWRVLSTLIVNR